MDEKIELILRDGTLVRHKVIGYKGKIEGTTAIKACFTKGGALQAAPATKEAFQYRVAVTGMSMRYISPVEDLEIVEAVAETKCVRCHKSFYTKPGLAGKARGRCACGGWICPVCMGCQAEELDHNKATACASQRKRFLKKAASERKESVQRR